MSSFSRIGIVTITYNSSSVIDAFMTSVLSQSYTNFILYIIDNASSDDTLDCIARYTDPRIVVIPNTVNKGIAAGNNQGINASIDMQCGKILLINNDTVFDPDLINKLAIDMENFSCDLIVPKIVYHDRPDMLWYAGGYFRWWRAGAGTHEGIYEKDQGQFDRAVKVEYSPTCCLLINSIVFTKVGIMDETYFAYYDDADFCYRTLRAGLKLYYTPTTRLLHKVSTLTGGEQSRFSLYNGIRGHVYFVRKHYNWFVQLFWLVVFQLNMFFMLFLKKISWNNFLIKQQGFKSGLSVIIGSS